MKKLVYSLFALLALSCTFVACSDDDTDGAPVSKTPAADCAGTYNGTWSVDTIYAWQTTTGRGNNKKITGDTLRGSVSVQGSATVVANDTSNYTANIAFNCGNLLNCNAIVNIIAQSGLYGFENSNLNGTNGLKTQFDGNTSNPIGFVGTIKDNTLETNFTLQAGDTIGTRRASTIKSWTYVYKFSGTK